ncbi:CPBP family intramembrane glutamic endopeptidase [Nonomuraea antri]|uniref:CPBP family intramembrane glutamic endopeptidase n=1 Tax=Nonomuraea antri TaxID=2730852 RepID=UPI002E2BD8F9|nr:CPBP family intramembrane glutamic endopeptidase [Nonomuraea antri]
MSVLLVGLVVIGGSVLWSVLSGSGEVRYSADHAGTVPLWQRWIPALAGIALVRLVPPVAVGQAPVSDAGPPSGRWPQLQAGVLLGCAVLFAVALRLVVDAGGAVEPAHTLLKAVLLLAVPMVLFLWTRSSTDVPRPARAGRRGFGPVIPVAAWFLLAQVSRPPVDRPAELDLVTLLGTLAVVFAVNALLEEVFYRRWLQTRWEHLLGRWPAIVLATLLFAAWHVAIMGTGQLLTDLAGVFASHGAYGLFLGYLWSRYRLMWPILAVHGAINTAPALL